MKEQKACSLFRRLAVLVGACLLLALGAGGAPVRAQSAQDPVYVFHTSLGNISVQLYPDVAPQTVANFLSYVNAGAYQNSLFHRSVPGFIIQGGGFQVQNGTSIVTTPTNTPVVNEFHLSNTRGTIAMAKLGSDPNSATSQWFFNESDSNASNLDNQNGGFTVFGKVTDAASLAVMDRIAAVPVPNPSPFGSNSVFNQIPLVNYQAGTNVQISNLVTVLSITPASGAHLLWNNVSGMASIWSYDTLGGSHSHQEYGPYAGWTAKAVADGGTDGQTRVLWDNADGRMSLWSLNNNTAAYTQNTYGPYPGWTATALSVGTDNTTHILWTNTDGRASLWNDSTASGSFTQNTYGPYPSWTAKTVSDGSDGKTRLLWDNSDGRMSLWSLDNIAGTFSQYTYGPYAGWTAGSVSVGSDGTTHVLWDNSDGRLSLWNDSTMTGVFSQISYGPFSGWTAAATADGSDGKVRVLWDKTDGTVSLWSLDNAAGAYTHAEFGPYSGWTAVGIAASP